VFIPVSVVVCTRNRVSSLCRAVAALLAVETAYDWELVIVDNASDDGTAQYLDTLQKEISNNVRLVTTVETKLGLAAARNRGWRTARGLLIAFTDDDCYVRSDFIDQISFVFMERPNLGFIGGRILLYDKNDIRMTIIERNEFLFLPAGQFVTPGIIQGANMTFRRATLELIGGFDEALGAGTPFPCEDIDAVAAALTSGISGAYDPRPTVYHHHGRKTLQEADALERSYAQGRGAFFAKYILKSGSRLVYTKGWIQWVGAELNANLANCFRLQQLPTLTRSRRELWAALKYLAHRLRVRSAL
jgi:glycosyltransferase involved in cell wall biosynthesis